MIVAIMIEQLVVLQYFVCQIYKMNPIFLDNFTKES